jgi:ubiquinone/menaquinone biosynthesis C-methylase UbiE
MSSKADYHLNELKIARSPADPRRAMPVIPEGCERVLDIGCGAGQTLVASDLAGAAAFGIDYDLEALRLGKKIGTGIRFVQASGEALPFRDGAFDFVFSRVALPYMRIPVALRDIARVLKPGGGLWLTLHPLAMFSLRNAIGSLRRSLFEIYRLTNTAALHLAAWQFRFPLKRSVTESWQTERGVRLALRKAGFESIRIASGSHFTVTARKPRGQAAAR